MRQPTWPIACPIAAAGAATSNPASTRRPPPTGEDHEGDEPPDQAAVEREAAHPDHEEVGGMLGEGAELVLDDIEEPAPDQRRAADPDDGVGDDPRRDAASAPLALSEP